MPGTMFSYHLNRGLAHKLMFSVMHSGGDAAGSETNSGLCLRRFLPKDLINIVLNAYCKWQVQQGSDQSANVAVNTNAA